MINLTKIQETLKSSSFPNEVRGIQMTPEAMKARIALSQFMAEIEVSTPLTLAQAIEILEKELTLHIKAYRQLEREELGISE